MELFEGKTEKYFDFIGILWEFLLYKSWTNMFGQMVLVECKIDLQEVE